MRKILLVGSILTVIVSCTHKADSRGTASPPPPGPPIAQTINQCLLDSCGPAGKLPNAYGVIYQSGGDVMPSKTWDAEFAPRLPILAAAEQESDIYQFQRVDEALKAGVHIPRGNPGQVVLAMLRIMKMLDPRSGEIIDTTDLPNVRINETALNNIVASWKPEEQAAAKMLMHEVTLPSINLAVARAKDPISNPLAVRLRYLYPKLDVRDAEIKDAEGLMKEGQRLFVALGPILGWLVANEAKNPVVLKAAEGKDLSKLEADRFTELAGRFLTFSKIFDGGPNFEILKAVPIDLDQEIDKMKESGELDNKIAEAKNRELPKRVAAVSEFCKPRLTAAIALNASGLRRQKALGMIEAVKKSAAEVAKNYIDERRHKVIKDYIDKLEFAFPDTNEENFDRLRQAFELVDLNVNKVKFLRENHGDEVNQVLAVVALINTTFSLDSKEEKEKDARFGDLKDIAEACEKLPLQTVSDATLTSLGKIQLSWFSIKFPEFGPGIIAHEIGHALSSTARLQQKWDVGSNQPFSKSLTCVANRNPLLKAPVESLKGDQDTPWSEEDWADHFSAQVLKQMVRDNDPWATRENLGCALVKESQSAYLEPTLANVDNDKHSSGIVRLLMIGNDLGVLPESCRGLLKSQTTGRNLTCE